MLKEVSTLNTFWIIQFLRKHHPEINPITILEEINKQKYYIENLKNGEIESLAIRHLLDTEYWVSHKFFLEFSNEILNKIPDPDLPYKMGKTSYATQPVLKTAFLVPLLGPSGVIKRIIKEHDKYNRIYDYDLVKNEKGHIILRNIAKEGVTVNRFAMEWHRGVYEVYAQLAGARDVQIELTCVDERKGIYDFDIHYKEAKLFSRILKMVIFNIPIVKQALEKAEEIQIEHKEQILNRDKIIDERTKQLRETQAKLVEAEKRSLEHRITGGFAHEMRNALTGAQLELKAVLDYREQGKGATEIIKEAATQLLKQIKDLQTEYQIPKDQITLTLIPSIKKIAEVIESLSETHQDVYHDLERGLSITSLIRDYAKLSELRPGNDSVDIVAMLKGYETKYAKDFSNHMIRYSVTGPDTLILQGDETHFNSIFSNLILNARDALIETNKEDKEIRISLETIEKDRKPQIEIKVRDNGPGILEKHLPEIFEPFFSTKPSSGTGLGLSVVKRLVEVYGGRIDFESKVNEWTTFTIKFPHEYVKKQI